MHHHEIQPLKKAVRQRTAHARAVPRYLSGVKDQLIRRCATAALTCVLAGVMVSTPGQAQRAQQSARFMLGAATALIAHESSHMLADAAYGTTISFGRVEFHGIPFFAVRHAPTGSPRKEFVIASAGFWMQHATSEWLLTRRPTLRDERAPFAKGMLAFNLLTSTGYAFAAFAETGPAERDTRSIAVGARMSEPAVGAMILAPALLDTWRYYQPKSRVAKWTSRTVKIGAVLLTARSEMR